jgi:hypothetical protein
MKSEAHALLLVDGLELNGIVCILSPARGASTVEVLFDVMPTETTDLRGGRCVTHPLRIEETRAKPDNYKGRA